MSPAVKKKSNSDLIILAWDLYGEGRYQDIIELEDSDNTDVQDLQNLARLELGRPMQKSASAGLFADLVGAMSRYHGGQYEKAVMELSNWLLHRGYYCELVLDRFYYCCDRCQRFDLLYTVCSKLIKGGHRQPEILGGYLLGAHESGRHDQVIQGFESFGKAIKRSYVLHRVALSYIHLNRNQEAESMLLSLYQALSGKPYKSNFADYKKRYASILKDLLQKEKEGKLQRNDRLELGMAHLFAGQYGQALQIFQSIQKAA